MKSFEPGFLDCVREKAVTSVRAGKERTKFTGIWMVVVNDRIFARPYFLAERSWYTTFLQDPPGSIKCGSTMVAVTGVKPKHNKKLMESVNKAYVQKYSIKEHNKKWVTGLNHPDRIISTIEFLPA